MLGLAAALVVAAALGYAGWRLWLKSSDMLRPVVVLRTADARALAQPPLGERVNVLLTGTDVHGLKSLPMRKLIALTFDDGPYPVTTPLLLGRLRDLHVPATFFLIGRDAEQFPDLARAIAADGHEIADHTLTHPDLDRLPPAAVVAELRDGAAALERIAPDPAARRLFRPPHGRYTADTLVAAQSAGFDTILWNDDPGDWRAVGPDALLRHIVAHATVPEIVLLHSGRVATVDALPAVVAWYRAAGYRFVTVGSLLQTASADEVNEAFKASSIGIPIPRHVPASAP